MSLPSFREITLMPAPWDDSELLELKEADVNTDHPLMTEEASRDLVPTSP